MPLNQSSNTHQTIYLLKFEREGACVNALSVQQPLLRVAIGRKFNRTAIKRLHLTDISWWKLVTLNKKD